jgi:HSP20 family molecular chaperone IbpA
MTHQMASETNGIPAIFKLLPEDRFFQVVDDIHRLIERRAYELFSARGFTAGHDLEDWLQAESEILESVDLKISETQDAMTAEVKLPGYRAKDIEIHVEPKRLFICGRRERGTNGRKKKETQSERYSNSLLCALDLPTAIDPEKVKATLSDGHLRIELGKPQAKEILTAAKAAA